MGSREIVSFDWAIKYILRDKANFVVLEGFLFALLGEKIVIESLLESESNQESRDMKFNRVDLIAVNSKGEHVIIEVQYAPEKNYFKRLLYGTSKDITDNIKSGEDYSNVKKVYSVSLIYFDVEANNNDSKHTDYVYHGKVEFTGLHNSKRVNIDSNFLVGYDINREEQINIFPEYFIISMGIFDNRVDDILDQWIYSFKNHEVKEGFKAPGIKEMSEKLDYISMTPQKQRAYNKYLEDLASDRGALEYARDEGRKEGREDARLEGKIDTAKKLLEAGSEIDFVSKITGLSLDEINNLK
ncbi:MAG: Rpn family recombination-promoting nuclease/putative transposase [Spirochaetaceae bacterium]